MAAKLDTLMQKKAKLDREIAKAKADAKRAVRREDDRRKILLGAFVLSYQVKQSHTELANWTLNGKRFDDFLTRDDERALFGLAPLAAAPSGEKKAA